MDKITTAAGTVAAVGLSLVACTTAGGVCAAPPPVAPAAAAESEPQRQRQPEPEPERQPEPEPEPQPEPQPEPEPERQPEPEPEPEPEPALGDENGEDEDDPFGSFGLGEAEEEPEVDEAAEALAADAKAINQQPVWQNAQEELWFMQTTPDDECHALQEWEHVMERYRQRIAYLYFSEQYAEALLEAEAGLVCVAGRAKPGAKPHKTGHAGNPSGGGIRKELLDSAARCALALGHGELAAQHAGAILETWPKLVAKDFGFWMLCGKAQVAIKHWAAANDMLCKAVTLRPTNYSGWVAITSMYKAASHAPPPSEEDGWDHRTVEPDGSPSKWKGLRDHSRHMVDGAALKWRLCASATARVRRAFLKYSSRDLNGELVACDKAEVGVVSLHAVLHSDPSGGGGDGMVGEEAVGAAAAVPPLEDRGAPAVGAGAEGDDDDEGGLSEWEAALVREHSAIPFHSIQPCPVYNSIVVWRGVAWRDMSLCCVVLCCVVLRCVFIRRAHDSLMPKSPTF
jgi:hypothetical protein